VVVYIHNGVLFSQIEEKSSFAGTWMEPEIIMLTEISQTEKRETPYFLSYAESRFKRGGGNKQTST
jgi:hypothetical protein